MLKMYVTKIHLVLLKINKPHWIITAANEQAALKSHTPSIAGGLIL
jgi:hypothetical protein